MNLLQKARTFGRTFIAKQPTRTSPSQDSGDSVSITSSHVDAPADNGQSRTIEILKQSIGRRIGDSESVQIRRRRKIRLLAISIASLALITLFTVLTYYLVHFKSLVPRNNSIQQIVSSWNKAKLTTSNQSNVPTDFTRDIIPIPCHSHNDEWRQIPLYDALAAGCTSIEADTWLSGNDSLFVGHSESSLTPSRSLESLYIDPLVQILKHQNQSPMIKNGSSNSTHKRGVFDTSPATSLVLFIDMKSDGVKTFPVLSNHLEPLRSRGFLTYFNGTSIVQNPITVVASGNTPFTLLNANSTYRDIFFDAPLDALWGEDAPSNFTQYTPNNSYYASVSFAKSIGQPWMGELRPEQMWKIRGQIKAARDRGLRSRYWDTPAWPISTRDHIWDILEKEGVGILNVDDLEAASKRKW